jgi:DNA-binding response OmpR family regulator
MNMSHRVLIVDDEPAISFALSEYFSVRGYEVDSAVAVQEAKARLDRASYDILITDLSLNGRGGAEGLELAALVRRHHPRTRIIILTAYGSAASEAAARRLGVDVFLHKPVPLGEIAQVLDGLAERPDTALDNPDLSGASRQPQRHRAEFPSTQS